MNSKIYISVFIVVFAFFFFFGLHPFPAGSDVSISFQGSGWSEPDILFALPDSVDSGRQLSASVFENKLNMAVNLLSRSPSDFNEFEFSYIAKIELSPTNPVAGTFTILSDTTYLAEAPSLYYHNRDGNMGWHALWGERRVDTSFDLWEGLLPKLNLFSTALAYRSGDMDEADAPVVLHNAGLSARGLGALRPADFSIRAGSDGTLHVVFQAFITNELHGGEAPFITYLQKQPGRDWEDPAHLVLSEVGFPVGVEPSIETLNNGQIILSYLGATPGVPQGVNHLLVITSDGQDGWSEPQSIFFENMIAVRIQKIYKDMQGHIHLLWGVERFGLPVINDVWHSYSTDDGNTWSNPEQFLVMNKLFDIPQSGILEYDIAGDSEGCLHWVGRTFLPGSEEAPGLYNRWCSSTDEWEETQHLDFINNLSFTLAVNHHDSEIYLLWTDEMEESGRQAIYISKKSVLPAVLPPSVGESGPLQLHSNYPNPFSLSTKAPFTLEESGIVTVLIYDMGGRQIRRQDLGLKHAGVHVHEIKLDGVPSGTYIYEIVLDNMWRQSNVATFVK